MSLALELYRTRLAGNCAAGEVATVWHRGRAGGIAAFVRSAARLAGCVERRMTVRTNPPGALLYVDDYEIGTTPVSANFTYYGTRKIRLVKDGYETLTVMQWIPPPWYEFPPMDFVSENFVPGQIRDQRTWTSSCKPQAVVPTGELLSRAEQLRRGVHAATGTAPLRRRAARRPGRRWPPGLPAAGRRRGRSCARGRRRPAGPSVAAALKWLM